jgi:hypothetical protein
VSLDRDRPDRGCIHQKDREKERETYQLRRGIEVERLSTASVDRSSAKPIREREREREKKNKRDLPAKAPGRGREVEFYLG